MKIRFIKNKDGYERGEIIEIEKSDFLYSYWMKKGCIEDVITSNPKNRTANINYKKSKARVKK